MLKGRVTRLCLDHCHEKGTVRGLLCNRCNRALGLVGDNVGLLRAMAEYLEMAVPRPYHSKDK